MADNQAGSKIQARKEPWVNDRTSQVLCCQEPVHLPAGETETRSFIGVTGKVQMTQT